MQVQEPEAVFRGPQERFEQGIMTKLHIHWLLQRAGEVACTPHYPVRGDPVLVYPTALNANSLSLEIATPSTSCSGDPPAAQPGEGGFPAISPDGSRITYASDDGGSKFTIHTVGVDGSSPRSLKTVCERALSMAGPFWLTNSTIGWVELAQSGLGFDIFIGTVDGYQFE